MRIAETSTAALKSIKTRQIFDTIQHIRFYPSIEKKKKNQRDNATRLDDRQTNSSSMRFPIMPLCSISSKLDSFIVKYVRLSLGDKGQAASDRSIVLTGSDSRSEVTRDRRKIVFSAASIPRREKDGKSNRNYCKVYLRAMAVKAQANVVG